MWNYKPGYRLTTIGYRRPKTAVPSYKTVESAPLGKKKTKLLLISILINSKNIIHFPGIFELADFTCIFKYSLFGLIYLRCIKLIKH